MPEIQGRRSDVDFSINSCHSHSYALGKQKQKWNYSANWVCECTTCLYEVFSRVNDARMTSLYSFKDNIHARLFGLG